MGIWEKQELNSQWSSGEIQNEGFSVLSGDHQPSFTTADAICGKINIIITDDDPVRRTDHFVNCRLSAAN
jgi:hypothetical protein